MLKDKIKSELAIWVSRHRRSRPLQSLAHAALIYTEMIENRNYDFDTNGEAWLLGRIGTTGPDVIFDVGANIGDWTAEVRRTAPGADVYSFELVPETAAKLSERFKLDDRVTIVESGLLDEAGTVSVRHYPNEPVLSGVALPNQTNFIHPFDHEWFDAPVLRGDDYCKEHGIEHIDYLKVDAEGSDHLVLKGFSKMLEFGAIGALQFEYGRANIRNKFLLADYYELLENMTIGKLYPTYVDFRAYNVDRHEDFLGPNFIAVSPGRSDLIALLSP
jgi:FkbM family methyltransferase